MKKVIKYIGIMFAFIFSFFILGKTDNISALDTLNYYHEMLNAPIVNGAYIWEDSKNIYFSSNTYHYELDKETSTWNAKTWNGLTNFNADYIWTDGTNYYYSNGSSNQYELDKETSTWNAKTWNNFTNIYGNNVWTDGTNYYYSNGSSRQYELDLATSTWNVKTWNNYTPGMGSSIWTDGENIYFSSSSTQYILDKETSTWNIKTWNGLTNFNAIHVWTDGTNYYYSYNFDHYELDKETSTWNAKTWNGYNYFLGNNVWTYENNYYMTMNYITFKFDHEINSNGKYTEEDLENAYQEGIEEGKASVDITSNDASVIETYCLENQCFTYEEYNALISETRESAFQSGADSVDITTDNEEYALQYIEDNNYYTEEEYQTMYNKWYELNEAAIKINNDYVDYAILIDSYIDIGYAQANFDLIKQNALLYEQQYIDNLYNKTNLALANYRDLLLEEGANSVDITTDNQSYAEQYIINNNYHSNDKYLEYGETKYQEGITYADSIVNINNASYTAGAESVDITTDNQAYAEQYIIDNNYYPGELYNNALNTANEYKTAYEEYMILVNSHINFTTEDIIINAMFKDLEERKTFFNNLTDDRFISYNQEVGEQYVKDNNYYTNEEYLEYSNSQYYLGEANGYNHGLQHAISKLKNNRYPEAGTYFEENYIVMVNGINESDHQKNMDTLSETMLMVENVGYSQSLKDSDAFLGLIPTTLGAVISNMMPILTYEVYGISLMNLIGLIAIIGIAIIIIKFIVG